MADLQISQLPQLAEADLGAADELAIVDDSASETKRITAKALVERGVALIDAGSIPGTALASFGTDTVTTAAIAADAVTASEIAAGAVGASEIADGSITATEIAANTITAAQIAANAIGTSELADDAVDSAAIAANAVITAKIADANVTYAKLNLSDGDIAGAKIANNSITAGQIATDAIGASELANNAVDTNAIANVAVTGSKIASNAITNIKITDATITGAKLVNDTITATQIAANAITASELADDAVDTAAILDDAVTAAKLAAGAVDTTALGAGAVTGAKIAGTTITAANIAAGTITATELAANSVGNSEIAANAVGASELADDSVDTAAIVNGAVTNAKIANSTITAAKLNLSDGDIAGAKLANNSITANQIAANAVGASELANDAVDTAAIADDAVTGAKIAATTITGAKIAATTIAAGNIVANTLTSNEIAPNAIGASELADNAVDTAAIVNAAVTNDKIANTTIAYAKLNLSNGDIAGAKIADNSLTATQIAANAIGASELADNAVDTNAIADDAVTGAKIAAATITGANIATGTITATQLAADSVGTSEIAANAVGASELADDAVDTAAIANLAVTGAKIAASTITAAKLNLSAGDIDGTKITNDSITATQIAANAVTASELADNAVDTAALAANSVTAAKIAANAVGASELADDAVDTAAVANGAITTAKIADGAVTTAKLSGTIEAGTLADGAVTTAKLADDAVTAAKLGAGAVDTTALGATSVTTAKIAAGAVTDAKVATGISGTKLTDATITAAKLNTANIDRSLNVASGNLGINNVISAGTSAGITYNAQGLITAATALVASDLPVATATAVGGVSVPTAGGLTVTGAGALSIAATTTGATATKVTFNNFGQITGTATLAAADLPVATASAVGAVSVPTGGPLTVDSNGAITVADSGVTAGTGTKVTVDAKGRVTVLANLTDSDLPAHSAALITSGSIPTARIANDAITGTKLGNASTTLFGSVAQTGFPTSEFTGQFFFDSVSEDLYIYDGNAYQPVTTLTKGSLVFGGTFNAATSKVASVTTAGAAGGLTVGSNVPTPTSSTDGLYLVVENAGTPSAPAPVVALAPPDYILGVTNTSGSSWEEIDLSQTVAGQVASNITFTPFGQLQSTNVQDALEELETEKLAKAGGTVTGQVLLGNTATLVFEGSSTDAYQTTLGVVNPTTADKTILLPNTSGTLITTNDSGTVTSAMIADGAILNADINASAAIAFTKLADLASAKILVGDANNDAVAVSVTGDISISNSGVVGISSGVIVDGDISGSAQITGSKVVTGTTSAVGVLQLTNAADSTSATTAATPAAVKIAKDAADAAATTANAALPKAGGTLSDNLIIDNAKSVRFSEADSNGAHYLALKAPDSVTADITFTLPDGDGSSGQRLQTDGSGNLSWGTDNSTDPTKLPLAGGTLSGDLNLGSNDITNGGTITGTFVGNITGNVTGNVTGNTSGSAGSCTGNAATASALASAVTIGGVSFDGSANINLAGVNTAGTQDTSGTAALATQFTVTANNSTNETVYPLFSDGATGSQGAETDTGLTYNPSTGALTSTSFVGGLTGDVTGNVSGSAGSCTGNAATATALATARAINGVNFDGSAAITITAAAGTLSGATLASGVTASSLTSVGTLTGLTSSGDINLNAQADLRFKDADSSHYVALQSPASVASSFTLTLPSADAAVSGYVLASDGSGTLSWVDPGSTSSPTFTGDATLTNDGALVGFSNLNATYTGNAKTLTVTVASKTGAHRYNGTGSSSGYKIDGKESPFLTLTPGRTYKFDQADNSNSGHPLRFYLEADKTTAYTTGVTTNGTAGSAGAYTQIVVSDTTPQILHYQCSSHASMGNSVQTNSNVSAKLATARTINGVSFDGSADVTVTAAAGTLTGTELKSSVVTSSLTSVGTLGSLNVTNNVVVGGNLTVQGTTTTVSSTTVEVADKNIELGKVSSPSNTTADGGGITLDAGSDGDKTWNWVNSTGAWTSSEHIQVASGKTFIGDGSTLTALNASNLASGTVATARLGSGTASSSNFLRGDGSWQSLPSSDLVNDTSPQLGGNLDVNTKNILFGDSANGDTDDVLKFGAGTDLKLYSDGTNGYVNAGTALRLGASTATTSLVITPSLISLNQVATFDDDVTFTGGTANVVWDKSDNALEFASGANITLTDSNIIRFVNGSSGTSGGNEGIMFGASGSELLKIFNWGSTGSSAKSRFESGAPNGFEFKGAAFNVRNSVPNDIIYSDGAYVKLYFSDGTNSTEKLATTSTGIDVTGTLVSDGLTVDGDVTLTGASANVTWDKSTDDLIFNDNAKAIFGTSSDGLEIYHDSNDSYVTNTGTGNLIIKGDDVHIQSTTGENMINCHEDGSVQINHNNIKVMDTDTNGISVYGPEGGEGLIKLYADEGDDNADKWKIVSDTSGNFKVANFSTGSWVDGLTLNGSNNATFAGTDFGFGTTPGGTPAGKNVFLAIGDSDTGIVQDGDGQLEIWANNTEVVHFNAIDGYVSTKPITTTGAVQTGDLTILNGNPDLKLKDSNHGGNNTEHFITFQDSSGNNQMNIGSPFGEQHLRIKHDTTELVKIQTDGKVGIGDTAPDALLSIKGDSNEASNPSIRLKDGADSREAWITNNSGDLFLANGGDDNVYHSRIRLMDGKQINFDIDGANALNIDSSRNASFAGTVSDSKGNLRSIPRNNQSSAYTLVAADAGKCITAAGEITVPYQTSGSDVFAEGDAVTIIADTGSDIAITQGSGLTMYNTADASTGSKTLAARGMCTIWFVSANNCYISGSPLS